MAGDTGTIEVGAPTPITERQYARLGTAGRGMLAEQARRIDVTKPNTELTPTERKVKVAEALRTGKNPETGDQLKDVNLLGGHLLLMPEKFSLPQVDAPDGLCVGGITQVLPDGSYEIYFAKVNPDGSAGDIVQDPGDVLVTGTIKNTDLVDLQAAAEADELRELFAGDSDAQKTFDAYTGSRQKGEKFVPPDKLDNLINTTATDYNIPFENNDVPLKEQQQVPLDRFIVDQIRSLTEEIGKIEDKKSPRRDQLLKLLSDLKVTALAQSANGEYSVLLSHETLMKLKLFYMTEVSQSGAHGGNPADFDALQQTRGTIDHHLLQIGDSASQAEDALDDMLWEADGSTGDKKKKYDKWKKTISEKGITGALLDKDFRNIEGVAAKFFGENLDPNKIKDIIDISDLSPEDKSRIWEFTKQGGKYGGIGLLAILLGIPLVAIMSIHKVASGGMNPQSS